MCAAPTVEAKSMSTPISEGIVRSYLEACTGLARQPSHGEYSNIQPLGIKRQPRSRISWRRGLCWNVWTSW